MNVGFSAQNYGASLNQKQSNQKKQLGFKGQPVLLEIERRPYGDKDGLYSQKYTQDIIIDSSQLVLKSNDRYKDGTDNGISTIIETVAGKRLGEQFCSTPREVAIALSHCYTGAKMPTLSVFAD
jgi:hypothetical protein